MMKVFNAPPELKPLIAELKQMGEWQKKAEAREAEIWKTIETFMRSAAGEPYIDEEEEKHGEVIFILDGLEFGRTISNYGSKLDEEAFDKSLDILLREGVIDQEEYDSIIKKTEKVVVEYKIDVTELEALATMNPELAAAVNRSKTPPNPRVSRVKPRSAKADNVSAASPYFAAKVETES